MKILYLAHRIPYPPNKGDKIRSFNIIKYLSQRHEIHLACLADDRRDVRHEEGLKGLCKSTHVVLINPKLARLKSSLYLPSKRPLSVPYFYSRKLQRIIDDLLLTHDFDTIFCFSSPMAEYVFRSRALSPKSTVRGEKTNDHRPSTKLIMDFVDVDSDKWLQFSKYAGFPMSWIYASEGQRLADYERKVAEAFDHSIFVTGSEVKIFKNKNPSIKNVTAVPNGVDLDYFSPTYSKQPSTTNQPPEPVDHLPSAISHQPIIVFTGAMDYYANIDGVVWFTKQILPLIKKQIPLIQFYIVGSNPAKEVTKLAGNDGVTVTGYVPDTREYLKKATVVVVPLRIARGIQNKILEAMAMGLPVVATPQAFEGIEAEPKRDLILEEDAERFGESVVQLIRNIYPRKCLGDNARKAAEDNYSWAKNLSKLDGVISHCVF
jgi:sugar transferase (PEP-CTERM/EpsH1 system associated)